MKTYEILFTRGNNENSTTAPDPVGLWKGQVDLAAQVTCCLSSDDDRPVSCNKYEVHTVTLPDFLDPEEWCSDVTAWKYTWGAGVDPEWPEAWQRGLKKLEMNERVACADLLRTKKFRNEFRASLCEQLKKWLEGGSDFRTPFSARQWECLINVYVAREADAISHMLYSNRSRAVGAPVKEPKKPRSKRAKVETTIQDDDTPF